MTLRDCDKPLLFEVSVEVACKVGGIYTVLRTKAPITVHEFGSKYVMIGSKRHESAMHEIEQCDSEYNEVAESIQEMRNLGVGITFGRWLVEGGPMVLLFDLPSVYMRLSEWKADLFKTAGIHISGLDPESNDAVIFGYLVSAKQKRHAIVVHFHEWLSSVGLILCRLRGTNVATIFTTHATILGRYLCAGDVDFYNNLELFDVDYEAGRRGIYHRYCIERAATHSADIFTTVSHITAYEAEHLLKRKPGIRHEHVSF